MTSSSCHLALMKMPESDGEATQFTSTNITPQLEFEMASQASCLPNLAFYGGHQFMFTLIRQGHCHQSDCCIKAGASRAIKSQSKQERCLWAAIFFVQFTGELQCLSGQPAGFQSKMKVQTFVRQSQSECSCICSQPVPGEQQAMVAGIKWLWRCVIRHLSGLIDQFH